MALVVLVPLLLMLAACLLERFEARAVPSDPTRRATRVPRAGTATPATTTATDAAPERHLRVVPGDDVDVRGPRTHSDEQADPQPVPQAS